MLCSRLAVLILSLLAYAGAAAADGDRLWVYLGTYTRSGVSKGIYLSQLDLKTGQLTAPALVAETTNPSFLAVHPSRPRLYAVGEMASMGAKKTGAVSAFAIEPKTGKLTLLNQQSSQGAGPCHVSLDADGCHALVANYGGGSVACLPIQTDGRLGEATGFVQHAGSSVSPRQKGPHAHSIQMGPGNRCAFAPDLGLDKVLIYKLNQASGKLTPNDPPAGITPSGAGPRHFDFHPSGRFAYAVNELNSSVTVFAYQADRCALDAVQNISTLPTDFQGSNTCADIHVHPSGRFVYASNRGHNSIAVFAVDAASGKLTAAGSQSTRGKTPRNFGLDPAGKFLLAANQDSSDIAVFRVDAVSGQLAPVGDVVAAPMPVCVKIIRPLEQ